MTAYSLTRTKKLAAIKAKAALLDQGLQEGEELLERTPIVGDPRFESAVTAVFRVLVFTNQGHYEVPVTCGMMFTNPVADLFERTMIAKQAVEQYLREHGWRTFAQIVRDTGYADRTIYRALKKLREDDKTLKECRDCDTRFYIIERTVGE